MTTEQKYKGQCQSRLNDTCALIGDGDRSFLVSAVKAVKGGELTEAQAVECFTAMKSCVDDALANFHIAIKLPEARATTKPRVVL